MERKKNAKQEKKAAKREGEDDHPDSEEQKVESFECYDELADQKRHQERAKSHKMEQQLEQPASLMMP